MKRARHVTSAGIMPGAVNSHCILICHAAHEGLEIDSPPCVLQVQ